MMRLDYMILYFDINVLATINSEENNKVIKSYNMG